MNKEIEEEKEIKNKNSLYFNVSLFFKNYEINFERGK